MMMSMKISRKKVRRGERGGRGKRERERDQLLGASWRWCCGRYPYGVNVT